MLFVKTCVHTGEQCTQLRQNFGLIFISSSITRCCVSCLCYIILLKDKMLGWFCVIACS